MSGQPNSWDEKYAVQRRRDHANIEAMQNLVIQRITDETGVMMPPKARVFISALQSTHGGGKVPFAPFRRSHLSIARYLQFTGSDVAREARVRRILQSLLEYQERVGVELFHVKRGGDLLTAEDGSQTHTATEYTDRLKPVADAAVMRARESEQWRKNSSAALHDQVDWAMTQLVRFDPREEEGKEGQMDLRDYANTQRGRLEKSAQKVADEIRARGGNDVVWMREVGKRLLQEAEQRASGLTKVLPREEENPPISEGKPNTLAAALDYLAYDDVPLFPVKSDKSPYTANGFKDATRDASIIRLWARKWPEANIGVPTGEVSGWLALDIDPRHGGDVSLTSLIEEHGDGWLETMQARTGGGGHHIIFKYPQGSNIRNSAGRLGEGIDVRGEGGYIIVPPSLHASGRPYEWLNNLELAEPPEWLIKLLTIESQPVAAKVRSGARSGASIGAVIPEGERNEALFKIGCALRGQGVGSAEIEAELLRINRERCAPPLPENEVTKTAKSAARYSANRAAIA
ncbi:MAG TPA: bifunctional DNA primase/polymerase [Pyrinomonadaceae bacterium]|jgi:hypothetical protein